MKSRQRKKTEEKHELEEEIGSYENKRINARRHCHDFSMEEKVRDRLCRPENSSGSSDLITVEFKINLGTLRFGIEGERE
ncbi:hypothetical protein HID58_014196 [Brassica napus]|uniref:Uncharacterized protein n=1 Tax=Brassica napus TaxID=3708 RepID=A0ABQ8AIT1_BRANA|nr:hypothetical protein HID58_054913 [Brassica napus]KAH0928469.1 hypothetical protein HID58_014196 [Brassica napus]